MEALSQRAVVAIHRVIAELREDAATFDQPMEAHLTHRLKAAGMSFYEMPVLRARLGIPILGPECEPFWSWGRTNADAVAELEKLLQVESGHAPVASPG